MFGSRGATDQELKEKNANAVAFIGDSPVSSQDFEKAINEIMSRVDIQKAGGRLSPDLQELIQYNALNQVVNNAVLLNGAKDAKIRVNSYEMDQAIQGVLVQYDIRDEKALKKQLKQNKIDFDDFENSLEESVKLQKFVESLKAGVTVSNADVENEYSEVHVRHILLRVTKPSEEGEKEGLAQGVYEKLTQGMPFEEGVEKFSEDIGTRARQGDIGWVSFGATVPSFEEVAFTLEPGKISRPVKTVFGYHIIQVLEKRKKPRPANLNYETEKVRILEKKQGSAVQAYIQQYLLAHPLNINYPPVSAYKAKMEGDYQKALGEYQLMISRNTYNPVPHYFIGQIYMLLKDTDAAISELKKGEVKMDLSQQVVLPELYLTLGDLYEKKNDRAAMEAAYRKAFENVKLNEPLLAQLLPVLAKKNMSGLHAEAEAALNVLKKSKTDKEKVMEMIKEDVAKKAPDTKKGK